MHAWIFAVALSVGAADAIAKAPPKAPTSKAHTVKADRKLTKAAQAKYRKALKTGRKAVQAGSYKQGIAAFGRALAVFADDPRALSERGWAHFLAGQLKAAQKDTRAALNRAVDHRLQGAGWYNLGRIHEQRGDDKKAIVAYTRSLRVRKNRVVKARLAGLDITVASPLKAKTLKGPFADGKAICADLKQRVDYGTPPHCARPKPAKPMADFLDAQLIRTHSGLFENGDHEGPGTVVQHVLLATAKGQFLLPELLSEYNPGAFGIHEEAAVETFEARVLPNGQKVVWIETTRDRSDSDMGLDEVEIWHHATTTICGVGNSGVPSCVAWIPRVLVGSRTRMEMDEGQVPDGMVHDLWETSRTMAVTVLASGALDIKIVSDSDNKKTSELTGTHVLIFP